jgi:glycine hydroxymethyltransferase
MFALGCPGDTVLEVQNAHTYAKKLATSGLRVNLNSITIPWDGSQYNIDLDRTVELIRRHRPELVVLGSAMFLFPQPVQEIKDAMMAHCPGSFLIYDAAHVMGLIAGGRFQAPLEEGADVVITSTHKTLAGPQGGMILTNDRSIAERLADATSPLMIANHHLARLPALAATFMEWLECGSAYADAIVANAKALGRALAERGVSSVGAKLDYTESHTLMPIVDGFGEGKAMADRLEACNVIVGDTEIPQEAGKHGLRIGVQEITRFGMTEDDAGDVASCIVDGMAGKEGVKDRALALAHRFKEVRFTVENAGG